MERESAYTEAQGSGDKTKSMHPCTSSYSLCRVITIGGQRRFESGLRFLISYDP